MKKFVLVGLFLAAICGRANAQIPVTDVGVMTNQLVQIVRMIEEIQQLEQTYNALAHTTNYGTIVSALQDIGIRNPLPVNPYSIQGILNGTGGAGGILGNLASLLNGTKNANTVYVPTGQTWVEQEIVRNGSGLAGAQAVALQLYQSAAQRVDGLTQLQNEINNTDDPSTRGTLIARLNAEQTYIQNANVQASTLGNYMEAQFRVEQQRAAEKYQMDADDFISRAQADGAW